MDRYWNGLLPCLSFTVIGALAGCGEEIEILSEGGSC